MSNVKEPATMSSELMMMVLRQEERRAKVAGTHVKADGKFNRRASQEGHELY
jgi:hypothetical protein